MNGDGPQVKTSRSRKSGAIRDSIGSDRRPRKPAQPGSPVSVSTTWASLKRGLAPAIASSSARKMMSTGVRAAWTKTTSASSPRSPSARLIDIRGVMPLPPERKRYFSAGWSAQVNSPIGPMARTSMPGTRLSCSQFDTGPPGTRFTVIAKVSGRDGAEAMV